jgi:hypothetical protein
VTDEANPESPKFVAVPLAVLNAMRQAITSTPSGVPGVARAVIAMEDAGSMDVLTKSDDGTYAKAK